MLDHPGLVRRRALAQRGAVVAAALIVLLVTTLLSLVASYLGAVASAGVEQSFREAAATDTVVQVRSPAAGPLDAADAAVRAELRAVYGPVDTVTTLAGESASYRLPRGLGSGKDLAALGFADDLPAHAQLVTGQWPHPVAGTVLDAVVPVGAARAVGLRPGDTLRLTSTASAPALSVRLVGSYQPTDPGEPYWGSDPLRVTGVRTRDFRTVGPFVLARADYQRAVPAAGATLAWSTTLDPTSVTPQELTRLGSGVSGLLDRLRARADASATGLSGAAVQTALPGIVERVELALLVARSSVLVPVAAGVLLAVLGLLLSARALDERRRGEVALLRARGASARQVLGWAGAEVLVVVVVAAVLGPPLGALLARALGAVSALPGTGSAALAAPGPASWLVAAVAALGFGAVLLATLAAGSATSRLVVTGRSPRRSALEPAGVDLALVALAVLALAQLSRFAGPLSATATGGLDVDPVLVLAPSVVLLGGAVVALRVLPLVGRAAERLVRSGRGLTAALAFWQAARRPAAQRVPALVLILGLATAVLCAGWLASLARSQSDQAGFAAGADLRATPPALTVTTQPADLPARFAQLPGVAQSMTVRRAGFQVGDRPGTALLVDARTAAGIMVVRPDQASASLADLLAPLAAARTEPAGVAVPAGTRTLRVTLRASKVAGSAPEVDALRVGIALRDDAGEVFGLPAGSLQPDGLDHLLGVDVTALAGGGAVSVPLQLLALDVALPASSTGDSVAYTVALQGISTARGPGSAATPIGDGAPWQSSLPRRSNPELGPELAPRLAPLRTGAALTGAAVTIPVGQNQGTNFRLVLSVADLEQGLPARLPVVASTSLLRRAAGAAGPGATSGVDIQASLAGLDVPLSAVGSLDAVPTLTDPGPAALADLPTVALLAWLADGSSTSGSEWWMRTTGPGAAAALRGEPALAAEVVDRADTVEQARADPLAAAVVTALRFGLFVGAALALVAVVVAATVAGPQRRYEAGVLRALGLSGRQLRRWQLGEQAVLVAVWAVIGVVLGLLATWLLVPLLLLAPDARPPVPPVLVQLPLPVIATLAAVVAAVTVVVAALVSGRSLRRSPGSTVRAGEPR